MTYAAAVPMIPVPAWPLWPGMAPLISDEELRALLCCSDADGSTETAGDAAAKLCGLTVQGSLS